jgi:hypothetical protein
LAPKRRRRTIKIRNISGPPMGPRKAMIGFMYKVYVGLAG